MPSSITVTPATVKLTGAGQTVQLSATVRDQDDNAIAGASVVWSSSNASVATVSTTGLVIAHQNGSAIIRATSSGVSGQAAVTVDIPVATTVTITPSSANLSAVGQTVQLAAIVRDQRDRILPSAALTWSSSEDLVATVDSHGLVTAVGPGSAEITARSGEVSGLMTVSVMQQVHTITLTPSTASMVVGDTLRISAVATDVNGIVVSGAAFTWTSSDESVASVDANGLITAYRAGAFIVSATSSGVRGLAAVTVGNAVPASITVTPTRANLTAIGQTVQLAAVVRDQRDRIHHSATVTWSSSDDLVATVDSHGLVTAVGPGSAEITARSGEVAGMMTISVMQQVHSITLTPSTASISVGDTLRIKAEATDANDSVISGVDYTWTSNNEPVASVDKSGLVSAHQQGAATITASADGVSSSTAVTVTDHRDRESLVALYNATNGANWTNNEGWSGDGPIDTWYGVNTDRNGRVTKLDLSNNNLTGSLPIEIGNLDQLVGLEIDENQLIGPLPSQIGNFTELTRLWLGANKLSGSIPSEIGKLVKLRSFRVNSNQLSGSIPSEIGNLARLESLFLNDNQLDGAIPPEVGNLNTLKSLFLYNNQLSGRIPPEVGNIATLRKLDFGNNKLTGTFPDTFADLSSLATLKLNHNELSGSIPIVLTRMGSLRYVNVTANRISGSIPPQLGSMTGLDDLRLSFNQLSGSIPPELGKLTKLGILYLDHNRLTGQIPPELGNLVNLRNLSLARNELVGTIPQELTRLVELDTFYLYDSGVCAPLNVEMQEWLAGITDRLADNCISQDLGTLAAFYWATGGTNWTTSTGWLSDEPLHTWHGVKTGSDGRVTHLNLDNNSLNGNLIAELGTLVQIEELSLQSNGLTGQIPLQLGRLGQLTILNLSDNDFKGTVPSELGDLTALVELILESNPLAGPLPLTLSQLNHLQSLRADNTQLCAPISSGFQIWLDGIAETRVEDCENRDRIALTALYNATDGSNWKNNTGWLTNEPLSDWFGVSISVDGLVTELKLAGNGLSGSIPAELTDLFNLSVLDLSNNSLTGRLPYEITRLGLESLRLDNTELCAPFDNRFQAWLEGIADRTVVNCENEERNALIALYHATDGSNWKNSDGWLSERPLHEWFGVTVDENGSVVRLDLEKNDLRGSIPLNLGSLSRLNTLNLSRNRLDGGIPSGLVNLKELHVLNLDQNKLGGTIPTELGSLEELRVLELGSNGLIGEIPHELGNLRNLIELNLIDNKLSGAIPPQMGNLANLRKLQLLNNEVSGSIPVELGYLENLEFLDLRDNNLNGAIPSTLGNLDKLRTLWLRENQLDGAIPSSLANLDRLRDLDLNNNSLSGRIPPELGSLPRLAFLELNANHLSGSIPQELGQIETLRLLSLNRNELSGTIPQELSQLSRLSSLDLSSNDLTGPIPLAFTGIRHLERLLLDNTSLCVMPDEEFRDWLQGIAEKTIPPDCVSPERNALVSIYNSTSGTNWTSNTGWLSDEPLSTWYGVMVDERGSVTELNLKDNNLLGPIPLEIGSLANLVSLSLGSNSVSGQIPDVTGELLMMKKLDLSQNNLSGSIPAELGKLVQLERLDLGENELGGYIPRELVQLVNLNLLDLHGTQLCIPSDSVFQEWLQVVSDFQAGNCQTTDRDILVSLYHATNGPDWTHQDGWLSDEPLQRWKNVETNESGRVTKLNLTYNGLIGHLPPELVFLSALETLILSGNRLSGQIPPGIESLTQLKSLLLDSNRLSGSIPPALGEITTLNVLTLHNNQFSGSIPAQLGNLTNLTLLSLASLDLSGSIPSELGKLSRLEELFLYENSLDGRIPRELGNLAKLRNLNLRNNRLSGPIPSELGNLAGLVNLWLNDNQLSGTIPPQFAHLESLKYLGLHNNQALEGPLPTSFTKLAIEVLQMGGTRLCTPPTEEFTVWLSEIGNQRVSVCESSMTVRAYLTQASQSLEYPVPLVAGKPALLRFFIADKEETGVSMPPLRATFYNQGMHVPHYRIFQARASIYTSGYR